MKPWLFSSMECIKMTAVTVLYITKYLAEFQVQTKKKM